MNTKRLFIFTGTICSGLVLTMTMLWLLSVQTEVARAAGPWYVTPYGNDSNSCLSTAEPCATIDSAIGKASGGDTIFVATGAYTGTSDEVVFIDKDITLSGGWNYSFTDQFIWSFIDGEGGRRGIYVSGVTAIIENFYIINGVGPLEGGGIYNGGTLTIMDCILYNNSADDGGGIYNHANSTLDISKCGIYNNTADYGGGIYNEGTLDISNSALSGNSALWGGGIDNRGTLTVTHSLIHGLASDNSADYGGGIYNEGTLDISNSTFYLNGATYYGGGISNWLGTVNITNSTFSWNRTEESHGGALDNSGTMTITNSILAYSPSGGNCKGTINDGGYNMEDDDTCGFGPGSWSNTDPLLAVIGDNGGPTWTHALLDDSPAIDAVPISSCTLATDQRGITRPQGEACDIGAFEYEAIAGLTASNDSVTILGSTTNFSATVTAGRNVSYAWDFGDETFGGGAVVTHTYEAPGIYTATVTASNSVSEEDADTIVTVVDEAIDGLTASNDSPTLIGNTTTFTATHSAGTNVSFDWGFGDETFGSGAVVTHTYEAPGIYTATVTASNSVSEGNAETIVTVVEEAISGLTASNNGPTLIGNTTTFTATHSAGTNVSFDWDFDDGSFGSGAVVTHTYESIGIYTATVTASNSVSWDTATSVVTVTSQVIEDEYQNYLPLIISD